MGVGSSWRGALGTSAFRERPACRRSHIAETTAIKGGGHRPDRIRLLRLIDLRLGETRVRCRQPPRQEAPSLLAAEGMLLSIV